VIVGRDSTVLVRSETSNEAIRERVEQMWIQHNNSTRKNERDALKERIASLTGGVGVIYVGGGSDVEQKERYDRVDDAVCAVRSALEEGILPGGGVALFNIASDIIEYADENMEHISHDQYTAMQIVGWAIQSPLLQIMDNAGKDGYEVMSSVNDQGHGYDVKNECYGDMFGMGIIDPLKVTKNALKNAVSVATTILSTNAIITLTRQQ
jgi:chaperonin GroEL